MQRKSEPPSIKVVWWLRNCSGGPGFGGTMMRLARLFTDHPASLGETYFQHCGVALSYAGPLALAAMAAAVHAVLPFLFKSTASRTIGDLNARMAKRCSSCALGPVHRPDLFVAPLGGAATK